MLFNKGRRAGRDAAAPTEGFADYLEACARLRGAAEEAARVMAARGQCIVAGTHHPTSQAEVDALCARTKALGADVRRRAEAVAAAGMTRLRPAGFRAGVRERVRWEAGEIERAGREAIAPVLALQEATRVTPLGSA